MPWIVLIISALFEAVWANALDRLAGGALSLANFAAFIFGTVISVGGLAWALRFLPVGTSYAIWVGIGATATVLWAVLAGTESLSIMKVVFIIAIVASVAGLKIVS
ncbi:MAG: SMR family transporter [Actinomycetaceae bacterium]|nr:SMR family transporter [Actinomycetaceae bacterium]